MRRKFLSFFSYAVIACMSAFALTACGGDDNEPDAPDTPDTPTEEASLVGTRTFYIAEFKEIQTFNADQTGTVEVFNATTNELLQRSAFKWVAFDNQIKMTVIDGDEEHTPVIFAIKRLDSECLILYNDNAGALTCIRKSAEVTLTKQMLVGTWLVGYQWDYKNKIWIYGEYTLNSDGTGKYIEDAYLSELGGEADEEDITWTFSDNTLTFVDSYGDYKVYPLVSSKNIFWYLSEYGGFYSMIRK